MTLMVVSVLLLQADYVQAATYTVGDSGVWTFNAVGWPKGKHFRAGDVLGILHILLINQASYYIILLHLHHKQLSFLIFISTSDVYILSLVLSMGKGVFLYKVHDKSNFSYILRLQIL